MIHLNRVFPRPPGSLDMPLFVRYALLLGDHKLHAVLVIVNGVVDYP